MTRPSFSIIDGAFHFFKVFGARPLAVLWITVCQILAYVGLTALMIWALRPLWDVIFEAARYGREPNGSEVLVALGSGLGLLSLSALLGILVILMVQGAWMRLLVRNELAPVIPFRLGLDELRLLGINILFWLLAMIAYIPIVMVFAAMNAGLIAADFSAGPLIIALANTVLVLVTVFAIIFVMLGFAASPALAVRQRGFRFFSGFSAATGVRGSMFVSYLLVFAVFLAGGLVIGILQQILMLLGLAELLILIPEFESAKTDADVFGVLHDLMTSPGVIVALLLAVLLQMLFQVLYEGLFHGVGAYTAIRHDGGFDVEADPLAAPSASVGTAPSEG